MSLSILRFFCSKLKMKQDVQLFLNKDNSIIEFIHSGASKAIILQSDKLPCCIISANTERNTICIPFREYEYKVFPFSCIENDLETHSDLEIILKYGRELTDQKILESVNRYLKLELSLSDISEFLSL